MQELKLIHDQADFSFEVTDGYVSSVISDKLEGSTHNNQVNISASTLSTIKFDNGSRPDITTSIPGFTLNQQIRIISGAAKDKIGAALDDADSSSDHRDIVLINRSTGVHHFITNRKNGTYGSFINRDEKNPSIDNLRRHAVGSTNEKEGTLHLIAILIGTSSGALFGFTTAPQFDAMKYALGYAVVGIVAGIIFAAIASGILGYTKEPTRLRNDFNQKINDIIAQSKRY